MPTRKLIIGNWKMNPATFEEAKEITKKTRGVAAGLKNTDVVACPPFPFLSACISKAEDKSLALGSQNVSMHLSGAHTGEVAVGILKDLGVEYVIVGHSEARESGETDEMVSKKAAVVLEAGMTAVVCVGEKVRDENGSHLDFLTKQMKQTFAGIATSKAKNIVIAYEPVWAIGAKAAMKSEDIYEMSLFVKKVFADIFGGAGVGLKVRVLYGGSVNATNAAEIVSVGKVDGLLVGRESVSLTGFPDLLRAVDGVV